jgi:hypothetical protein
MFNLENLDRQLVQKRHNRAPNDFTEVEPTAFADAERTMRSLRAQRASRYSSQLPTYRRARFAGVMRNG